jgi:hypothetical protein
MVRDPEPKRMNEVQTRVRQGAHATNISRVLGDLRTVKDYVKHAHISGTCNLGLKLLVIDA